MTRAMSNALKITAACLAVLCLIVYACLYLPDSGSESVEELARQALEAGSPQQQEQAAVELAKASGPAACQQLHRVLRQSNVPAVRAACIHGLGTARNYEAMDLLLDALEDESPLVRGRAGVAVTRMIGRDYHFRPQASDEERAEAVNRIRKYWNELDGSPQLEAYKQRLRRKEKPS